MARKKSKVPKVWFDVGVGLIVTVLGGLVLLLVQQSLAPKPTPTPPPDKTTSADIKRLAGITLDSPIEYAKQQMGAPPKTFTDPPYTDLVYNLDDYVLKISTTDNQTINSLTYLLKNKDRRIEILPKTNTPSLVLGEATFGDYADRSTCAHLTEDTYGRKVRFFCDMSFGRPGNYWKYRVGSHSDSAFMQKLSADAALHTSLSNIGVIAEQTANFASVARTYDELDMFYDGEY